MKKLIAIQAQLKAPKNQRNDFGKYNYRSAEDILEAAKPLLAEHGCLLLITDDITETGGRIYVKATVNFTDGTDKVSVTAYAREEENKKGMDGSQITGAASSYARKYALNGLFLIDDTKDADATNRHENEKKEPVQPKAEPKPELKESTEAYMKAIQYLVAGNPIEKVTRKYTVSNKTLKSLIAAVDAAKTKQHESANN